MALAAILWSAEAINGDTKSAPVLTPGDAATACVFTHSRQDCHPAANGPFVHRDVAVGAPHAVLRRLGRITRLDVCSEVKSEVWLLGAEYTQLWLCFFTSLSKIQLLPPEPDFFTAESLVLTSSADIYRALGMGKVRC